MFFVFMWLTFLGTLGLSMLLLFFVYRYFGTDVGLNKKWWVEFLVCAFLSLLQAAFVFGVYAWTGIPEGVLIALLFPLVILPVIHFGDMTHREAGMIAVVQQALMVVYGLVFRIIAS